MYRAVAWTNVKSSLVFDSLGRPPTGVSATQPTMPAAGSAAGRSRRAPKRAAGTGEAHQSKIQDFFQQNKLPRTAGAAGGSTKGKDEEENVEGVEEKLGESFEEIQETLSQTPTQPDVAVEDREKDEDGTRGRAFHFRDAVHGDMTRTLAADAGIKELCATGPFQRLLETKQLGACFHVFERAVHTRAEHSVGVCYLASRMLDSLTNSIMDLRKACGSSVPNGCPVILFFCFVGQACRAGARHTF